MAKHTPTELNLHRQSRVLEITFDNGAHFNLPAEYLRVFSPSAEVQGHGPGQEVLQIGKQDVNITEIRPVGAYAIKICFDDGHNSGLYDWRLLYDLGSKQRVYWKEYLQRLAEAGHQRQTPRWQSSGDKIE